VETKRHKLPAKIPEHDKQSEEIEIEPKLPSFTERKKEKERGEKKYFLHERELRKGKPQPN